MSRLADFWKKEAVLCIAFLLAVFSACIVPPDKVYVSYIDFRVLTLLFCLMTVMAGLQAAGIFNKIAHVMLKKAHSYRQICLILVFICFFASMLITNDVALITFVPFTIMVFEMAGLRQKLIPVIVLQTIAANLGSMMTPVGNPQNLYLYAISGMSLTEFMRVMYPLTLVSGILLFLACLGQKSLKLPGELPDMGGRKATDRQKKEAIFFLALFLLSLTSVLRILPSYIPLAAALAGTLLINRTILAKVDYCLLLTFVSFFIFVGNIGRMESVRTLLESAMKGREMLAAFASSQIISNVPAAILLSGFTDNTRALLQGVNIGGLGTLIASLASLISYKFYAGCEGAKKGTYILWFTISNLLFAAVLLATAYFGE